VQIFDTGLVNYVFKPVIAVGITPLLYLVHAAVDPYLGHEPAASMAADAHSAVPLADHH
jgi:hypothetical protein